MYEDINTRYKSKMMINHIYSTLLNPKSPTISCILKKKQKKKKLITSVVMNNQQNTNKFTTTDHKKKSISVE